MPLSSRPGTGRSRGCSAPPAKKDGVKALRQRLHGNIYADVGVGLEDYAFGAHLLDAAINDMLFKLEVRNAVAEQAADAVVLFKNCDGVAGAAQLLRSSKTRGAAADDGDALARGLFRRLGMNPALVPGALHDRTLDELDRNRRLVDAEHACGLARSGTNAARELGKIVGRVEAANRCLPAVPVDQIVPVGNEIVDRAAGVAEGHTAIHAASALLALLLLGERLVNFEPILDALVGLAACGLLASDFQKACDLTHVAPPQPPPREATKWWVVRKPLQRAPRQARACTRAERP